MRSVQSSKGMTYYRHEKKLAQFYNNLAFSKQPIIDKLSNRLLVYKALNYSR